jgi:hypothetical protein
LCPGRVIDVFLHDGGERRQVRATIVRAYVVGIEPRAVYQAALHFHNAIPLDPSAAPVDESAA